MVVSFEDIPLEVQEQIFSNLTPKDLRVCSTVCSQWHAIINSNQIWLKMCALEGLTGKKFLDDDLSLICNPTRQFTNEINLEPLCHWKSHYKRYKYVKKNWRIGYNVKTPVKFTPIHANEQFIIQHLDNDIIVWDVCGNLKKFCSIPLAIADTNVDTVLWKGDYIVYVQKPIIVCLKRGENSYKEVLKIQLDEECCAQVHNNCVKQKLTIKLSDRFLLVQEPSAPCILNVYDISKGKLQRKLDLHRGLGFASLYASCVDSVDDKIFVAYRTNQVPYVSKYNFSLDTWECPIVPQTEVIDLFVSKKYLLLKFTPETRDCPYCLFQVWDHTGSTNPLELTIDFFATKHLSITLNDNDVVFYHYREEIKVLNINTKSTKVLATARSVMKFVPIWDQYLAILDEKGVSVWDWKTGSKINSPFRDNCVSTFYVSETNIVVRTDSEKFYIVSYW